ncbi:MAG: hypothetical protein NTY50_20710 [Methylobacter sp.]|nr:hypothetical protein [Methylobacter sp.]
MTDEELKTLVASLAIAQQKTDEHIASLFVAQKETDEQMKRTDEQMKRTDQTLKNIGIQVGGVTNNQGDVAEEFFFNSLVDDAHLGPIHFDDITKNMQKHRGHIQEEYDLVMTNGEAVGIIEVKYKAHENDLDKLERKMRNFKKLFPVYNNYKLYGAIASFHINNDAKSKALARGFFVMQRSGKVVHTDCAENLMVL